VLDFLAAVEFLGAALSLMAAFSASIKPKGPAAMTAKARACGNECIDKEKRRRNRSDALF
jgi:hypothetical protein